MFQEATGTPIPVEINGKTYKVSPLTPIDFSKVDAYIKGKIISLAMEQAEYVENDKLRGELINAAIEKANQVSTSSSNATYRNMAAAYMESTDCVSYYIWLSISKNDPEFTKEDALGLISNSNEEHLIKIISTISGMNEQEVKEAGETKKKIIEKNIGH